MFSCMLAGLICSDVAYGYVELTQFKFVVEPNNDVKIINAKAHVVYVPPVNVRQFCKPKSKAQTICGIGLWVDRENYYIDPPAVYRFNSASVNSFTEDQASAVLNSAQGAVISSSSIPGTGKIISGCLYTYYATKQGNVIGEEMIDGGVCGGGKIPPAPTPASCQLTGNVNIDYGTLNADKLSGLHKAGSTTVVCNKNATVNLAVYNATDKTNVVELEKDGSLSAKLTVDGADVSKKQKSLNVKANVPTAINIDSELAVSGTPPAGAFNGSAVAVITIQ